MFRLVCACVLLTETGVAVRMSHYFINVKSKKKGKKRRKKGKDS